MTGTPVNDARARTEGGLTLLEITVTLALFATFAVTFALSMGTSIRNNGASWRTAKAIAALQDVATRIQDTANQNVHTVYGTYHGQTFPAAGLAGGTITVTCYRNETAAAATDADGMALTIPALLGGRTGAITELRVDFLRPAR